MEEQGRIRAHELEAMRLKLEIARREDGDGRSERSVNSDSGMGRERSIDEVVRIVRMLTVKVPSKPEGWSFFFKSLEKAFESEKVEQGHKARVLVCLLGEKAANLLSNLESEAYQDYEAIKKLVLREFEPTPKACLDNFRRAKRYPGENFMQFATRLTAMWEYYCQLRGAQDVVTVNQLIVSDRLMTALDYEITAHIMIRQGDSWFKPKVLAEECDRFFTAKGRSYTSLPRTGTGVEEAGRGKMQAEVKREVPKEKNNGCFSCGSKEHFRRDCPKLRGGKRQNDGHKTARVNVAKENSERVESATRESENKDSAEEERIIVARVDSFQRGKTMPFKGKLERVKIGVNGKTVEALSDSGSEVTVVRRDIVPDLDLTGAPCIYIQGVFGPPVRCPLAKLKLTDQRNGESLFPTEILCAIAQETTEKVLIPPEILKKLSTGVSFEANLIHAGEETAHDTETEEKGQSSGAEADKRSLTSLPGEGNPNGLSKGEIFALSQRGCVDLADARGAAKRNKGGYFEKGGLLYHKDKVLGESVCQLVLPRAKRLEVMELAHSSVFGGHLNFRKTLERVRYSFFWEGMRKDLEEFCKSCEACQLVKPPRTRERAPITPVVRPELPFQNVNADLIGPIEPPSSKGHKYILCLVDQHTRWAEAVPLTSLSAKSTCEALLSIFMRTGIPNVIASDNGTNFNAALTQEFEKRLGASPRFSTPGYPASNGLVERFNKTLKNMLHHIVRAEGRGWHAQLPYALWAYREIPNATTGVSPFQLLYGRPAQGPLSILKSSWIEEESETQVCTGSVTQYLKELKSRLERAAEQAKLTAHIQQQRMAHYYNLRSSGRKFKEGDRVVVLIPDSTNKLYARWQGPGTVEREVRPHSFLIKMEDGTVKHVHQNKIREFVVRSSAVNIILEGEEEFGEVDAIPTRGRKPEYGREPSERAVVTDLTGERLRELLGLLGGFRELFSRNFQPAGVGEHQVDLIPGTVRRKPHCYGIPMAYRKEVDRQVQELLDLNLIEPSVSEITHPVVCVAKKDATVRLCIDFRALNSATRVPSFPMKDIHELIYTAGRAEWLTSLDLRRGYWQIRMEEKSKPLTAFATHTGVFQWRVMPFGLAGAAATFQREMNRALRQYSDFAQAYIDDIVIFSPGFKEHLVHLKTILSALDELGFSVNLDKCNFAARQLNYLGHKIGGGRHGPGDEKIEAIRKLAPPVTKKEVRSVLGLMGFYRSYIPNYAAIAAPLTELTKKKAPNNVKWGAEEDRAFSDLKGALCRATQLATPDLRKPFQVHADASNFAVGGCLTQQDEHGNYQPIAFISKKLTGAQRNWATIEKEAWGVLFALTKFEKWILGGRVEIITDHNPLKFLNETTPRSPKLTRWALALQRWDYHITHKPGALHLAADAMSRLTSEP